LSKRWENMTTNSGSLNVEEKKLVELLGAHIHRDVPGSGIVPAVGRVIPEALRPIVRRFATNVISGWQRRVAKRLARQRPLRLNFGCGTSRLEGWINVDLIGLPVDLSWDIRRPLPFEEDTVEAIFHEHVFEHIDAYRGYHFLKECHRILKPGGVMRMVLPDAARYLASYFDPEHKFLNVWRAERFTPMLAVQEEFYSFGHRAMYDYETVALFCRVIGFEVIEMRQFGDSRLIPCPDSASRIPDSFYTEVVK
jgi:predicted SAM-dependent methyltransferase